MKKKVLPTKRSVKFILAEDVRAEANGKFSLLGVFPGEEFHVAGDPPPELRAAFVIPSVSFVFIVTDGQGEFSGGVTILGPDKKPVGGEMPLTGVKFEKGKPATISGGARPFIGAAYGTYFAELRLENARFRFPIRVSPAPKS